MFTHLTPRTLVPSLALLLSSGATFVTPVIAGAQPSAGPARATRLTTIDAALRRDVVDTIAADLRRHYVDADTGALIAAHLQKRLGAGVYDSLSSPGRFAEVLTNELRAVNGDRHLRVMYDPENPGQRPGADGVRMFGPPPPGSRPSQSPPPNAQNVQRLNHYSLGRIDILPGNVGYLDVRGFAGVAKVEEVMRSALEYLEGTDAIVFDLRRNGGGSPRSVNFLISHFTTSDTVASLTVTNRSGHESFTRYTLRDVPGPRRPDVPLYVLTSGQTASAGEDFSFVLKNMKRATLVGARTAGAGHNNAILDVGHGFNASVSFTRVSDPRTGAEWERVGVIPDVEVDQARALDVAHVRALETIAARESDPRRRRVLELTKEAVEAEGTPRAVPPATLAAYVGEYLDGRSVTIENNRLYYSPRPGAPPDALVPLDDSTFAMNAMRLSFARGGSGGMRLTVRPPEGEALTYDRQPAK